MAPENQIDHRSYERQGIEQIPTIHEGHVAREMGERSERVQTNQQIKAENAEMNGLNAVLSKIQEEARMLIQQITQLILEIKKRVKDRQAFNEQIKLRSETRPEQSVAQEFKAKFKRDMTEKNEPSMSKEFVAANFRKKFNADMAKRNAQKQREQRIDRQHQHARGGPKL